MPKIKAIKSQIGVFIDWFKEIIGICLLVLCWSSTAGWCRLELILTSSAVNCQSSDHICTLMPYMDSRRRYWHWIGFWSAHLGNSNQHSQVKTINRNMRASELYSVWCVNAKAPTPRKAKNLYISAWFGKAKTYVECTKQPWFILSAKFGLVEPNRKINPYDQSINSMPIK